MTDGRRATTQHRLAEHLRRGELFDVAPNHPLDSPIDHAAVPSF